MEEEKKGDTATKGTKKKNKASASGKKFKISTHDANHVQPLLKKLIAAEEKWQEV